MNGYRFSVPRGYLGGSSNVARVREGESPLEEVVRTALDDLSTDLELTIGGVTMFVAAWQDPDHWETEWREEFPGEEPEDVVARALAAAREAGD